MSRPSFDRPQHRLDRIHRLRDVAVVADAAIVVVAVAHFVYAEFVGWIVVEDPVSCPDATSQNLLDCRRYHRAVVADSVVDVDAAE